jgi:glycosyltransferase involved in cell wall biosynthesis
MISIIIPSYNSESTIGKCLGSLLIQSFQGDQEIIVIDSSSDRTPAIIRDNYPSVRLFHFEHQTDPGTARNLGIGHAKGDLIAFLDSDCVAAPDWLEKISAAHQSGYRVAGGAVCNGNKPDSSVAWAGYLAEFREFIPEQPRREVSHIPSCNISYRRTIFEKYGSFSRIYYPQEDLVFNSNLRKWGEAILFDPAIRVSHHHRTRLNDFLGHQQRIGSITARVMKKIELDGSGIVRHPAMAVFVIPLLPIVKYLRTLSVFVRLRPRLLFEHPAALFILGIGLIYWMSGFARGVFQQEIPIAFQESVDQTPPESQVKPELPGNH